MTTLEILKWDGKKGGKVSIDLKVAKETSSYEIGKEITVTNFEVGQKVDISGKSMGRGFSGYQKTWF